MFNYKKIKFLFLQEEVFPLRNKLDQYEDSEEEEEGDENDIDQYYEDEEDDDNDDDKKHISDSDIEGAESGSDDLPNDKAWGKLRKSFYNTDYLDKDHGGKLYNNFKLFY